MAAAHHQLKKRLSAESYQRMANWTEICSLHRMFEMKRGVNVNRNCI
jgi:hypothetical protein